MDAIYVPYVFSKSLGPPIRASDIFVQFCEVTLASAMKNVIPLFLNVHIQTCQVSCTIFYLPVSISPSYRKLGTRRQHFSSFIDSLLMQFPNVLQILHIFLSNFSIPFYRRNGNLSIHPAMLVKRFLFINRPFAENSKLSTVQPNYA